MKFLNKLSLSNSQSKKSGAGLKLQTAQDEANSGFKLNTFTHRKTSLGKNSVSSYNNIPGMQGSQAINRSDSTKTGTFSLYNSAASTASPSITPAAAAAAAVATEADFDDAASYHSISSDHAPAPRARPNLPYKSPASLAETNERDTFYSIASSTDDHVRQQFNNRMNSPASSHHSQFQQSRASFSPSQQRMQAGSHRSPRPSPKIMTIDDILQAAIKCHDAGELEKATAYFKKAAEAKNTIGMLFYGLSLRHGWGCQANESMAFAYLQKAGKAITSGDYNLNSAINDTSNEELSMALYELGTSYRHGWGVPQCKKTAAHYFEIAANNGDADAQVDLASCYEKGDGVKRDMKKAAYYYRQAHSQGHEIFGNSWIFKKKYDGYVPESVLKK